MMIQEIKCSVQPRSLKNLENSRIPRKLKEWVAREQDTKKITEMIAKKPEMNKKLSIKTFIPKLDLGVSWVLFLTSFNNSRIFSCMSPLLCLNTLQVMILSVRIYRGVMEEVMQDNHQDF